MYGNKNLRDPILGVHFKAGFNLDATQRTNMIEPEKKIHGMCLPTFSQQDMLLLLA